MQAVVLQFCLLFILEVGQYFYKFSLQGIAKDVLFPLLPQFTQAFVEVLAMSDSSTVECGLKMEVLKVGF